MSVSLRPLLAAQQDSPWVYGEWCRPWPSQTRLCCQGGPFPIPTDLARWVGSQFPGDPWSETGGRCYYRAWGCCKLALSLSAWSVPGGPAWWVCPPGYLLALLMLLRSGCGFHRHPVQFPDLCWNGSLSLHPNLTSLTLAYLKQPSLFIAVTVNKQCTQLDGVAHLQFLTNPL